MMMSSSQNLARCEVMNTVSLCLLTIAAKAALVLACRQSNLSLEALAGVLGMDQPALSRMLDPRQVADTDSINRALRILGSELVLEVRALAHLSGERSA